MSTGLRAIQKAIDFAVVEIVMRGAAIFGVDLHTAGDARGLLVQRWRTTCGAAIGMLEPHKPMIRRPRNWRASRSHRPPHLCRHILRTIGAHSKTILCLLSRLLLSLLAGAFKNKVFVRAGRPPHALCVHMCLKRYRHICMCAWVGECTCVLACVLAGVQPCVQACRNACGHVGLRLWLHQSTTISV